MIEVFGVWDGFVFDNVGADARREDNPEVFVVGFSCVDCVDEACVESVEVDFVESKGIARLLNVRGSGIAAPGDFEGVSCSGREEILSGIVLITSVRALLDSADASPSGVVSSGPSVPLMSVSCS